MIQIVLDTNVLVSGLLSPLNAPGRIIDALRMERIRLVIDYIFQSARRITSTCHFTDLPDPYDACFLEVAATAEVTLVTDNLKHFPKNLRRKVEVLSSAEFPIYPTQD